MTMVQYCCVPCCQKNKKASTGLCFFKIPEQQPQRSNWLFAIFRKKDFQIGSHAIVCGTHFVSGMKNTNPAHPDYVPSIFRSTTVKQMVKLHQKYVEFRHEQEKMMKRLNSNVDALTHLLLEKNIQRSSQKKLYVYDGNTPQHTKSKHQYVVMKNYSKCTLGQPTQTVPSSASVPANIYRYNPRFRTSGSQFKHTYQQVDAYIDIDGGDILSNDRILPATTSAEASPFPDPSVSGHVRAGHDEQAGEDGDKKADEHCNGGSARINDVRTTPDSLSLDASAREPKKEGEDDGHVFSVFSVFSVDGCGERQGNLVTNAMMPPYTTDNVVCRDSSTGSGAQVERAVGAQEGCSKEAVNRSASNGGDVPVLSDHPAGAVENRTGRSSPAVDARTDMSAPGKTIDRNTDVSSNRFNTVKEDDGCVEMQSDSSVRSNTIKFNKVDESLPMDGISRDTGTADISGEGCGSGVVRLPLCTKADMVMPCSTASHPDSHHDCLDSCFDRVDDEHSDSSGKRSKLDDKLTSKKRAAEQDDGRCFVGCSSATGNEVNGSIKKTTSHLAQSDFPQICEDHSYHVQGNHGTVLQKKRSVSPHTIAVSSIVANKHLVCERILQYFRYQAQVVLKSEVVRKPTSEAAAQTTFDYDGDGSISAMETLRRTLVHESLDLQHRVNQHSYTMEAMKNDPSKVLFYTGFPDYVSLLALYDYIVPHVKHHPDQSRTLFEEMVMTLIKLRLGLRNYDLAYQSPYTKTSISHCITGWFDAMYCCLAPLLEWPPKSKHPKSFYYEKVLVLKRRYYILENVYENLKTSDTWLIVKGVRDVIVVCDVLGRFHVKNQNEPKDFIDPFQIQEPLTEEESSSEEEEVAEENMEKEEEEEKEEKTMQTVAVSKERASKTSKTESASKISDDIQRMLDANIDKDFSIIGNEMNLETSLITTSLVDSNLEDASLPHNAFSNYPGVDSNLSSGYSTFDTALISQLGLDTVQNFGRSRDSVFSQHASMSSVESLLGLALCGDAPLQMTDVDGGQSDQSSPVKSLDQTISLLANRLNTRKGGKRTSKSKRSPAKTSPRTSTFVDPAHLMMTSIPGVLTDHRYFQHACDATASEKGDLAYTSFFSQCYKHVRSDHSYCSTPGVTEETSMDLDSEYTVTFNTI